MFCIWPSAKYPCRYKTVKVVSLHHEVNSLNYYVDNFLSPAMKTNIFPFYDIRENSGFEMDVSMEVDESGDQTGAEEGTYEKRYVLTCTLVVTRDLNSGLSPIKICLCSCSQT